MENMKKIINAVSLLLRTVLCRIFGHKFVYLRTISKDIVEKRCNRCKVVHALGFGKVVKVTKEIRELHDKILTEGYFG